MTKRPALGCLVEIIETLVLTLIIFLVIQNFVAQPYQVEMDSMERTLEPGQYVLVDKLTPRFDTYQRGDIVVFHPPAAAASSSTPYIKRVIGVPGDTVEIRDDGLVYINDVALDEPYLYGDEPGGVPQATTASLEQTSWTMATVNSSSWATIGRTRPTRGSSGRWPRTRSSGARGCATGRSTRSGSWRRPS